MTDLHPATRHQNDASDPSGSTWLSANAGSGKTRVLTDRVARLLLQDVDPQNILCLTYTKAAASEMQNRLFKRLGEWAMLPSDKLRDELSSLGVEDGLDLGKARTLFARAIETPGGLKIQTIHSFCAALLRRFPVEAGVSPQFAEMDETAQARLIADVLNRMAETDGDAIGDIARIYRGEALEELAAQIAKHRDAFGATVQQDEIWAEYGLPANLSTADVYRLLRTPKTAHTIHRLIPVLAQGSVTDQKAGAVLAAVDPARIDESDLLALESVLLFKGKAEVPFGPKIGKFPTAATRKAHPDLAEAVDQLMEQVAEARHMRVGLSAAENTLALHRFAAAFLPAYEAEKRWRGWLDFDDLIGRTIALLSNPSVAAWVLFRLDGGIDHILVDEAQDTSPAQWRVVDLLAGEFGAGLGARENIRRTLFVVGDKKQSIYSFQGADAEAFDRMRIAFKDRLQPQGGLASRTLEFSFRSSRGVLDLVDRTFDGPAGQGLGLEVRHRAFHETMPGRVDLWPLVPKAEDPVDGDWTDPVDQTAPNHATAILSQHIADEIHRMIHDETVTIPTQGGGRKRVDEGDILILVQGRSGSGDLFHSLIRACKKKHLKVAGADRLRIGGELAVRDLRALLAFLALPEDSLSLAAALRSPLFGWSEEQLFNIAARRTERYLWEAMRKADDLPGNTHGILDDLLSNADFMRPYDLIERILVRHGGRRALVGRLGPEAEDGIDELLNQALTYEQQAVPSLTGFLAWLEGEDVEVKRQLEAAGGRIRVMTVHGAKGLESPIVILPDTLRQRRANSDAVILDPSGRAHWKPAADESPDVVRAALDAKSQADEREHNRLLYVAMTRAESWLIVCGAGDAPKSGTSWYQTVAAGIERIGGGPCDFPPGQGLRYAQGGWPETPMTHDVPTAKDRLPSLEELGPAGSPAEAPKVLAPSDLGGAKALPGDPGLRDEAASLRRGRQIHLLLEHLPEIALDHRAEFAGSILESSPDPTSPGEAHEVIETALTILKKPELAHVFSDDAIAEVEISASLSELGGSRISGAIDRLLIDETRVLAVDFKSNAIVPRRAEDVPLGLLRQMGAYAAALAQIYPEHRIDTAILWTTTAELMPLPHEIVRMSLQGAPTS